MPYLVQYRTSDSQIEGVWSANTSAMLAAQIVQGQDTQRYLELDALPAGALAQQYYVPGDVLTAKTPLTLTATPTPFVADGVAVCAITVTPFVECTLLVNGVPYALVTGDATLLLTSDVPATFVVTLAPLLDAWAPPITVEAL
jgi:hypothetical protein